MPPSPRGGGGGRDADSGLAFPRTVVGPVGGGEGRGKRSCPRVALPPGTGDPRERLAGAGALLPSLRLASPPQAARCRGRPPFAAAREARRPGRVAAGQPPAVGTPSPRPPPPGPAARAVFMVADCGVIAGFFGCCSPPPHPPFLLALLRGGRSSPWGGAAVTGSEAERPEPPETTCGAGWERASSRAAGGPLSEGALGAPGDRRRRGRPRQLRPAARPSAAAAACRRWSRLREESSPACPLCCRWRAVTPRPDFPLKPNPAPSGAVSQKDPRTVVSAGPPRRQCHAAMRTWRIGSDCFGGFFGWVFLVLWLRLSCSDVPSSSLYSWWVAV